MTPDTSAENVENPPLLSKSSQYPRDTPAVKSPQETREYREHREHRERQEHRDPSKLSKLSGRGLVDLEVLVRASKAFSAPYILTKIFRCYWYSHSNFLCSRYSRRSQNIENFLKMQRLADFPQRGIPCNQRYYIVRHARAWRR